MPVITMVLITTIDPTNIGMRTNGITDIVVLMSVMRIVVITGICEGEMNVCTRNYPGIGIQIGYVRLP